MIRAVARPARAAALATLLSACSSADRAADGWAGTIDTLPGGAVVVDNTGEGMWDSTAAWRLVEELRVGSAEGSGPDVFSDVHDLAVDEAGRIHVLQRMGKTVHVFDSTGRFVRAIGRPGKGPGELETPMGMLRDGEGLLWIADSDNARYTAFDSLGGLVARHTRPLGSYGWRWNARFMPDGRLVEHEIFGSADGTVAVYLRLDSAFTVVDTLLRVPPVPRSEDGVFVFRRGTSTSYVQVPFWPREITVLDERGYHWTADPAAYRLVQRTLDGDTVRVVTRRFEPVAVVDADIATVRESYRELIEGGPGWEESRIPRVKPAFSGMTVADDGVLWLRAARSHGDSLAAFDVFDTEGRYRGLVRAPVSLAESGPLLVQGGAMYGVVRDELDVPMVVRLRIERDNDGSGSDN